jgi:hypothetical protein
LKTEIITYEDNDKNTKYILNKGDGTIIIDLEKLLDATISECEWLGENKNYLELMYLEWDSTEHFAIVSNNGEIVKKGILKIHHYISKINVFVVLITGFGLGENDATYYNVDHDDQKMAVIDEYGKFILTPEFNKIKYFDDEDVFYADGHIYDFDGKFIGKDI